MASAPVAATNVRAIVSLRQDAATRGAIQRGDIAGLERANAARSARVRASLPADVRLVRGYRAVPAIVVEGPQTSIDALASNPDVESVAPDAPIHPLLDESAALINADDVRNTLSITGTGVTVAVLDTGVDTDHAALADDVSAGGCFLVTGGCPQTAGVIAGCPANAFTTGSYAEDGVGHGTHVSGIITSDGHVGGQDIGIARDAKVKAFKVIDDCSNGEIANLIDAYDEILASHPDVRVVNMSVGDGTSNAPGTCETRIPAMTTAVQAAKAAGIISFASSGNTHSKTGVTYPACINDIVSVGAVYDASLPPVTYSSCTDATSAPDQVVCFSQSGPGLDLLAPGALVESSWVGGGWLGLSGTSMSSPAAAAVAALVLSNEPALSPADVETRLKVTGVPVTDAANGVTKCRVDALKAVLYAPPLCQTSPLDTDADGCSDAEEATFVPSLGGMRDASNPWDFFDVTADKAIDLVDTLNVLSFFGQAAPPASPANLRDRYIPDLAQPWRTDEANNGVDLQDALANLKSFGNTCTAAP
jgi:subtilisin family serine protease